MVYQLDVILPQFWGILAMQTPILNVIVLREILYTQILPSHLYNTRSI